MTSKLRGFSDNLGGTAKHGFAMVAKENRVCEKCERTFLSGNIVIKRGYIAKAICYTCIGKSDEN